MVKTERGSRLATLEAELKLDYLAKLQGKTLQLLVESNQDGISKGTSCRYATVRLNQDLPVGQLVDVEAVAHDGNEIEGRPL